MNINDLDEKNPVKEVIKSEPKEYPGASSENPEIIDFTAIADVLNLDHSQISRQDSKLRTLMDYVKENTEDLSMEGIKWAIRDLQLKIGTPPFGEKPLDYLTRYAFLLKENHKINDELDKFKKGGIHG